MKKISFFLVLLISVVCVFGQQVSTEDSTSIAEKIDDWNNAWGTKDPQLATKWYSENADFTNAFGFNRIGRQAIEVYLTEVFKMPFVMAGKTNQTSLILRSISENVVLAISTVERKGQQQSDGSELGTRRTTHHRLFVKKEDWLIQAHLISDARSIKKPDH